ncbi:MAG: transketolase [Acidimicrobiia bacterium]
MPSMRDKFTATTIDLLESDPRTTLVLADIGASSFAGAPRVHNVGIREQAMIGVTAGLALSGLRPIAHSYAPFLIERPFEQIKLDFGHQDLSAILVSIGASYDAAMEGRTHQSPGDVSLLSTLPGWTIHVPGHPDEAEGLLRSAAAGGDRVYIRLTEDSNSAPHRVGEGLVTIRTSWAPGATVIAVGPMLDRVAAATADLNVTLLYANTVRPFDRLGLAAAATGTDVVLVEPYLVGTSAAEVSAALSSRPSRLLSIGVPKIETRRYGTRHQHDASYGLDIAGLRTRIVSFLDGGRGDQ